MYDGSTTAVRCAVGVTEGFEVKVGLHQGSALSPCLFAMVMGRMTDEIREEAPWTMMFANDIVICSESKEHIHLNPERSFGGTNGEPPSEASQLRKGARGYTPGKFQKPTLQMVQSMLFLSYIL